MYNTCIERKAAASINYNHHLERFDRQSILGRDRGDGAEDETRAIVCVIILDASEHTCLREHQAQVPLAHTVLCKERFRGTPQGVVSPEVVQAEVRDEWL